MKRIQIKRNGVKNYGLSAVDYINELCPLDEENDMPITTYVRELRDCLIEINYAAISHTQEELLNYVNKVVRTIAQTYKMLSEMEQAVINYAEQVDVRDFKK